MGHPHADHLKLCALADCHPGVVQQSRIAFIGEHITNSVSSKSKLGGMGACKKGGNQVLHALFWWDEGCPHRDALLAWGILSSQRHSYLSCSLRGGEVSGRHPALAFVS